MYDMDDLTDLILAKYENADAAQLADATLRQARVVHFEQRAVDDIWYDRGWPFSMSSATLTMSSGSAARPSDFAGLTGEGGLWDSLGRPYQEISYQDMSVLRARGVEAQSKLFSVGTTILIPDTSSTGTFTLVYQKTAPELTAYGTSQAVPLPYAFWEAILLGAVSFLKSEKGDQRPIWALGYREALSKQQRLWRSGSSRPSRLPQTVGGQW
jgi:hypothetical protein